MAASNLRRIQPGTVISGIPGRTWNAFVDAVSGRPVANGQLTAPHPHDRNELWVRNDTGADILPHSAIGLERDVTPSGGDTDVTFAFNTWAVRGVTPQEVHRGRFGITQDLIGAGKVGRVLVSGLTIARLEDTVVSGDARLDITPGSHRLSEDANGAARYITRALSEQAAGTCGEFQLCDHDSGCDDIALILIGGGGAATGSISIYFEVLELICEDGIKSLLVAPDRIAPPCAAVPELDEYSRVQVFDDGFGCILDEVHRRRADRPERPRHVHLADRRLRL